MRGDFHTVGDIAYRDDEGYFYICDRKKDMIISGGMNIYPAEIEAALEQHPDIYDVGRVRHPVARSGARACTPSWWCGRAPTLTDDDVMAFAREHLAGYKIPRSVSFLDELPRDRLGQDPQARAPRPLLGRPHLPSRLTASAY